MPAQQGAFDHQPEPAVRHIFEGDVAVAPELLDGQNGAQPRLDLSLFDPVNRSLREPDDFREFVLAQTEDGPGAADFGAECRTFEPERVGDLNAQP